MKRKTLRWILIILTIFLILISFNKFFYQKFKNGVFLIFSPLQKFLWSRQNAFSSLWEAIFRAQKLKIESQVLKKENFILKSKILKLQSLEKENQELREILNFSLEKKFQLIKAKIIAKKTPGDWLLIDKGEKDQVKKNQPVITKEKVLVGKIGKVFDDFSQVILITDKNFTFSVKVKTNKDSVLGVAKGEGGLKLTIDVLPKEAFIQKGALVSTSLLGEIFPEDLLVGELGEIKKNDAEPFQKGKILPYFKELKLETLFLIKKVYDLSQEK